MASHPTQKWYYHHVPKTGGLALRATLVSHFSGTRGIDGHRKPGEAARLGHVTDDYYGFAVVRNPYERFVSAWNYLQAGGTNHYDRRDRQVYLSRYTFAQFCASLGDKDSAVHRQQHFRPQSYYIPAQNRWVQHVFHSPDEALQALCAHVGRATVPPMRRVNESVAPPSASALAVLDQAAADAIYEAYREDFERFGYDRDSWKQLKRNVQVVA